MICDAWNSIENKGFGVLRVENSVVDTFRLYQIQERITRLWRLVSTSLLAGKNRHNSIK